MTLRNRWMKQHDNHLAVLRSDTRVSVDVILQRRNRFEHTRADCAFVRSLLRMRLQMTSQQVSFWACVVAVVAHQMGSARRRCADS